ncbi:MAG TPA: family 78 glycoside hydrolase catalytic domain [Acidimicrobiia bacterium]
MIVVVALVVFGLPDCSGGSKKSKPPAGPGAPTTLTVDGLAGPIGLAPSDVVFAWHVDDRRRGATQSAYQIAVSRVTVGGADAGRTTTVWDSGRVASSAQAFVSYAGPALASDAVYDWTVQTWDGAGSASPPAPRATFETGLVDNDWKADWIRRTASTTTEPDQYTYARKEVTLARSPIVRARAYVSGDQQYEMYVNGSRVGKGEAYNFPDSQYYETLDLTHVLRAGAANAIGLLYNWQGPTKGHPAGAPGVITEIRVTHQDGQVEVITTDGTWRVRKGAWLAGTQRDLEGDLVDYTENINGPDEPIGWDRPGFDASSWAPAAVIGLAGTTPWTHLVSVRTRIVYTPVRAVSVTRLSSGSVVADFGKVYAAIPTVSFHHGVAGHVIAMHAGFVLDRCPDAAVPAACVTGEVSRAHDTQHTDMSYSYVQRGGGETFEPFDYLGFRYLQIDTPGETLAPGDIVVLDRHTAVPDEHAATFSSSNPTIDAVFALGAHSALYTAQEQYIDTPTREKGSWLWDGFNESETAMAAFGEQNLSRKSLLEFAQSQGRYWSNGAINKIYPTGLGALDINEFTEIYPEWVWQYWMHTGDRTLLESVYPVLKNISHYVDHAIDPATGLVSDLPSTSIYYDFPTVTRINVLGVNVFRRIGEIATLLHRPQPEISFWRSRQSSLTTAINAKLTRPDGTYVDGMRANHTQVAQAAQETNACALYYGVVPAAKVAAVGKYIARLGLTAPPRTAGEVIGALAKAGLDDDLVKRLTDEQSDGWANILARGGTFTWEVWQPSDVVGDSMSHGWGANVLVEIQHALLGVTPDDAGYASFAVAPPPTGLDHATGTVPTPAGAIVVAWARHSAPQAAFTLDLTVPANTSATVRIPAANEAAISEGGQALAHTAGVTFSRIDGDVGVLRAGAGTYHFSVSR